MPLSAQENLQAAPAAKIDVFTKITSAVQGAPVQPLLMLSGM